MKTMPSKNTDRVFKLLRWGGTGLIGLVLYFYWTGIDELVSDQNFWFFGLGISGILFSIGILSIFLSLNEQLHRTIWIPFVLLCFSIILTIIGVIYF